jgi:hypothetical protein
VQLRRQDSNLPLASNRGDLTESTTPERQAEGEGIEPPRPKGPTVFETGYRSSGSPSEASGRAVKAGPTRLIGIASDASVAPAGVEPATLRLRGGSSAR